MPVFKKVNLYLLGLYTDTENINMINLKNLKSLFVVEEEEAKKQAEAAKNEQKKEEKSSGTPPKNEEHNKENKRELKNSPPPPKEKKKDTKGQFDQRNYEFLMSAIEKNNLEGFDFLEFKSTLKALDHLPMDEATKYQSAFATASTLGLTKDKLLSSADYYKDVLHKEKEHFLQEFQQQVEQRIHAQDSKIQQLNQAIINKSEQIKKLQEEIKEHQAQLAKVQSKVNEVSFKIEKTKNNFMATYEYLIGKFNEDVQKLKEFLG